MASEFYLHYINASPKKSKENKAISMMRGKSPRSDVEMSKQLNFVAAILDFLGSSRIDNGYMISLYAIYGNNHLYQIWYFNHKVNDRYTKFTNSS